MKNKVTSVVVGRIVTMVEKRYWVTSDQYSMCVLHFKPLHLFSLR